MGKIKKIGEFWNDLLGTVNTPKQIDASEMLTNTADSSFISPREFFVEGKTPAKDTLVSEANQNIMDSSEYYGREYTAGFESPGGQPIEHWYDDKTGKPWGTGPGQSNAGAKTRGIGHKEDKNIDYDNWDSESSKDQFNTDYEEAENYSKNMLEGMWDGIPSEYQNVVTDMVFNMGGANVKKNFQGFLAALYNQDYERAAQELQYVDPDDLSLGESDFYQQVPNRVKSHQSLLRR
jgi:GH24 family phage-related lysozyme (muramidase)